MEKKIVWGIIICILTVILTAGILLGAGYFQRENDPNWQMAKKLYNLESALQDLDESWELESLNKVTPYCYQNPDGTTITYYCCTTTYIDEAPSDFTGLNRDALKQVVDLDLLENCYDCKVNNLDAVMGELDGKTYLCWTISPVYSCVLEYVAGTLSEADIFRMAESVASNAAE